MPNASFDIRVCESCGLRYPLVEGHPFGTRCPICMGTTQIILSRPLIHEPDPIHSTTNRQNLLDTVKLLDRSKKHGETMLAVLLDNIRSAWNVGSILRSADGFGFNHAYLCGITPTADHEAVTKTSLGAEDSVPWSYHKDAVRLVKGLKVEGWKVYGLEEDQRAVSLRDDLSSFRSVQREVIIVGNEVTGVDPELLDLCDEVFYIPMLGEKKSFNVAIAFSIAAYAFNSPALK